MPETPVGDDAGADLKSEARAGVTPDEIRQLAAAALVQAQQVSILLGRLGALLDDGRGASEQG